MTERSKRPIGGGAEEFPLAGAGVLIELVQAPPHVIAALGDAL
jgi:hypothetical protein